MPKEPTYTLDEARAVLARQECDRDGHDLDQTTAVLWRQGLTAALARGATIGVWNTDTRLRHTARGPYARQALGPASIPIAQRPTMHATLSALFTQEPTTP